MRNDRTGSYVDGSQRKLAIAEIAATMTPMVRAATLPEKMPVPARATMMPAIRWIQPQVVTLNSNTHDWPMTKNSSSTKATKPTTMTWNTPITSTIPALG